MLFEAVADFQLARFRAEPSNRNRVLSRGLWAWSRHPNYFGETVMWWGFFLIGFAAAHAWWLILSPILVSVLLLQVTGVTPMEEKIAERRPAYAEYRRRVSSLPVSASDVAPWAKRFLRTRSYRARRSR